MDGLSVLKPMQKGGQIPMLFQGYPLDRNRVFNAKFNVKVFKLPFIITETDKMIFCKFLSKQTDCDPKSNSQGGFGSAKFDIFWSKKHELALIGLLKDAYFYCNTAIY